MEEFREKYMLGEKVFDFKKFSIVCNECGSKDVEFGGVAQLDWTGVYYEGESPSIKSFFVCKCHACGNGFALKREGVD